MKGENRITPEEAYLCGGWAPKLNEELQRLKPKAMTLVGDWSELSLFEGAVGSVRALKISGTIDRGVIQRVAGLNCFRNLVTLVLASRVKEGLRAIEFPPVEVIDLYWQDGIDAVFGCGSLKKATLRSVGPHDLACLPEGSGLQSIWLAGTSISTLEGLKNLSQLEEVRISDAKALFNLNGIDSLGLRAMTIENARNLADITAIRSQKTLQKLLLINVSKDVNLSPITDLQQLEYLQIGGAAMPEIDWRAVVSKPTIKRIFAWWQPDGVTAAEIRAAVRAGRSVTKFEPTGGKKRQTLFVEIQ